MSIKNIVKLAAEFEFYLKKATHDAPKRRRIIPFKGLPEPAVKSEPKLLGRGEMCEDWPACGHENCYNAIHGLCDCGAKQAPGSSYCRRCLKNMLRDMGDF